MVASKFGDIQRSIAKAAAIDNIEDEQTKACKLMWLTALKLALRDAVAQKSRGARKWIFSDDDSPGSFRFMLQALDVPEELVDDIRAAIKNRHKRKGLFLRTRRLHKTLK